MATLNAISDKTSIAQDVEALHLAFKGLGTDVNTVIRILGHRNSDQRQLIIRAYKDLFQGDLIKRLESELSGEFEKAMYRWMLEPADRDAVLAHVAINQGRKHYHVLVEIVSVLSPEEVLNVRCAYHDRYKRSLEEDVAAHTTGDLRQVRYHIIYNRILCNEIKT
ncbi:PREDICTED: annexin-like protein RJ4 [Lupinus angustifolius]|uniref:annexin-like protein RJ4 n=1 Tax=Lupinus angustifolius TaxID=3871 RepID=UPI00092EFD78|nr:PREDICTED: annexin-like protein RJ4 [Lupinus angustifolius]